MSIFDSYNIPDPSWMAGPENDEPSCPNCGASIENDYDEYCYTCIDFYEYEAMRSDIDEA